MAVIGVSCAGSPPTGSDSAGLASEQPAQDSPCSASSWHVLHGSSIGRGDEPARHRESEVELDVDESAGFEVGRSSVVHSAQGDQLLVEVKNIEQRWRCGIRSYPSLAYAANGERTDAPPFDDIGYTILAATGMHVATREGIRGTCLGPGETGYLQIRVSEGLAKVSIHLEATSDGMQTGPPPTCMVPDSYAYSPGQLSIQAHTVGLTDPTYKPAIGSGLAVVLPMDEEQLPLAMYSFAPSTVDTSASKSQMPTSFVGAISLNAGTSQSLAVLVW